MNAIVLNYLLYALMIIISLCAQIYIMSSYKKYKGEENHNNLSGQEVARKILDANGLSDVYVVEVQGELTDHYDPARKTVRLSSDIFHGETIASSAVAAHECGHAIQDKVGYIPMRIRSMLVFPVNLTSKTAWIVILLGILFQYYKLFIIGIGLFSVTLLFQLVTLPVELDASRRAKIELEKLRLVSKEEGYGVAKMLKAAAMTYVASVLTSILQIFRLLVLYSGDRK